MFKVDVKERVGKYRGLLCVDSIKQTVKTYIESYAFTTNDPTVLTILFVARYAKDKLDKYFGSDGND
jgi:hypothetical protein